MIYLFSGDDAKKKLAACENFIKTLPKEADVFSIDRKDLDPVRVESLYSGAGLFSPLSAVIFDGILEREEARQFILGILPLMGKSENIFIFREGKLTKPLLDAFKKSRAEINVFELPKDLPAGRHGKKERFDNFLVANAFAGKDKLNTWIYFRQAVERGAEPDALAGILFWKIKDMILRRNFSKFSEKELQNFAGRISYLLPEARKKGQDAEAAFEKFLLEAF